MTPQSFCLMFPTFEETSFTCGLASGIWVPLTALGLVLLALGGWPYLLWGVFFRTVVGLHCTWLVNSATHMWGSQRFQTHDTSRNSFWVAMLTFGEGWHNNHHAEPQSPRHGLVWYEFDLNWYGICAGSPALTGDSPAPVSTFGDRAALCYRNSQPSTHLSPPEQGAQREDSGLGNIPPKALLKPFNPATCNRGGVRRTEGTGVRRPYSCRKIFRREL
jgi:hypothetical protein